MTFKFQRGNTFQNEQKIADCQYLHSVVGMLVVKDKTLLAELVIPFQIVNIGFVINDVLLICFQIARLFL